MTMNLSLATPVQAKGRRPENSSPSLRRPQGATDPRREPPNMNGDPQGGRVHGVPTSGHWPSKANG